MKISLTPALNAEMTFSLTPPIIPTLPLKVISPVMLILVETGIWFNAEIIDDVNVTPALGPSFGTPPAGT